MRARTGHAANHLWRRRQLPLAGDDPARYLCRGSEGGLAGGGMPNSRELGRFGIAIESQEH